MFKRNNTSLSANGLSRSGLTVVLLALITLLVTGLVWQAAQSVYTNRATATRVLQDYARLASDEYVRQAMGQVGYYGYYAYVGSLSRQVTAGLGIEPDPENSQREASPNQLAEFRFLVDPASGKLHSSRPVDADIKEYLTQRAIAIFDKPAPESGLTIDHRPLDGQSHTFIFSTAKEAQRVFGFAVDRTELSARLRQVFEENTLLPESLAGGSITNKFVFLRVTDDNGQLLFESPHRYDPYLLVSKSVDDAYDGVFKGYVVDAAIDSAAADSLVIGGLPRSRLPALLVTVLLTIGLLIAAFRQLYREQALMNMRSEFISEVSHELRTPLTQIRMFTETLLFERFKSSDDNRRALKIINRESQRLIHLVENVLRFSGQNGNRRELRLAPGKLAPVVESVIEEFRPLAEASGATMEFDLDAQAVARFDDDALRQVLLNLLDNAVKYGPARQRIRVELLDERRGVVLRVCDQGPGIPVEDRERIWDGYCRLDRERQSAIAGTGIGLSVVRDLVVRHGGSVTVADGAETGACFSVELPKVPK